MDRDQFKTEPYRTEIRGRRQAAAQKYRPNAVRLLLVAEAPPKDNRYFYFEDVTAHDWLFREVSESLLGRKFAPSEKAEGLAKLRGLGVFLIDLKLDPVDGSSLQEYVPDLVRRCRDLNAERIILIKATVFDAAYGALKSAGLPVVNRRIPFPSTGQQRRFRERFAEALGSDLSNK